MLPMITATGSCMTGPPPDLNIFTAKADAQAGSGEIDPLQNLRHQKLYLFHGYNDAVVAKSVTDAAADCYRHYLGNGVRGNLYYQSAVGAGHSLLVRQASGTDGLNQCADNQDPNIDQCGYDPAGILLQHVYGAFNPPNRGSVHRNDACVFDQSIYSKPDDPVTRDRSAAPYLSSSPKAAPMAEPAVSTSTLHGCKQDAGDIELPIVDDTGDNAWADTNHLIILYPQTRTSSFAPFNPEACWDILELRQSRGQLRHQIRRADRDDQGDAGCADSQRSSRARARDISG